MKIHGTVKDYEFRLRLIIFIFIIGLFFYPIIHANIFFVDDNIRSLEGHIKMAQNGRYISEIIFLLLNASKNICDIAPLIQIISIVILSFSLSIFSLNQKYNRLSAFLALPLIVCSPYFNSNISYRFDCITMSLSLACALMPFSVNYRKNTHMFLFNILFILLTLNLYQASMNVFLACSFFISLFDATEGEPLKSFTRLLKNLSCFAISLLIYKGELSIFNFYTSKHAYPSEHSQLTYSLSRIGSNFFSYSEISLNEFGFQGGSLEYVLGAGAAMGLASIIFYTVRNRTKKCVFLSILYVALSFVSLTGILPLLKNPILDHRVMIANGVFLCLCVTFLVGRQASLDKRKIIPILLGGIILTVQIIISFEWGNLSRNQADFIDRITTQIVEDVYTITKGEPSKLYLASGTIPVSPQAEQILKNRPVFKISQIPSSFTAWGAVIMRKNGLQDNIPDSLFPETDTMKKNRLSCLYRLSKSHRYYDLYKVNNDIIIDFNKTCTMK